MRELARRIFSGLSEEQRKLAAACVLEVPDSRKLHADRLKSRHLETYLENYFKDPLAVVRRQNDFIRGLNAENRKPFFRAAVLLNALVEKEAHVRPYDSPSSTTHHELRGAPYLFHGDILPGTRFRLGQADSYDRELLKINKDSSNTLPYTVGARRQAVRGLQEILVAKEILSAVHAYSPRSGVVREPRAGQVVGAGTVIATGDGVCRHKAALLVQCLQEAGLQAQYARGDLDAGVTSGRHAWVHAVLDGEHYILDPEWGIHKRLHGSNPSDIVSLYRADAQRTPTRENPVYRIDSGINVVWRRRQLEAILPR